ncbi:MAG: metallophosphoesterase [Promethearchaeota archaeon]
MLEQIKFIDNTAAILIKKDQKRILIVADLHLGIESSKNGLNIPSQTSSITKEIIKLIKEIRASELILLGDIKHSIPQIAPKEWINIPKFFKKIAEIVPISIIRGNHDGDIDALIPNTIKIYKDLVLPVNHYKIGMMHGHMMIPLSFFQTDTIIVGHTHPTIEFRDDLGIKSYKNVWIRAKWDKRKIAKAYLQFRNIKLQKNPVLQFQKKFNLNIEDPDIIVMPVFNKYVKGYPINYKSLKLLGPIFQSGAIKLNEAEIILLDGTYLGKLGELMFWK